MRHCIQTGARGSGHRESPIGKIRVLRLALVAMATAAIAIAAAGLSGARASSGSWTTVASLPQAESGLGAAVGSDGRIYAIGGQGPGSNGESALSSAWAYAPSSNTWTSAAPLPTARTQLAVTTGKDGRIYALGGNAQTYDGGAGTPYLRTVEAYTPGTNSWATVASMPTERLGLAAATGADGTIYAIGGENSDAYSFAVLSAAEAYNPQTNTWTTLPSMPTARSGLAAVTGPDGRIYAIGGHGSQILNTVEVYDPSTRSWSTAAPLTIARDFPAAALGPDGLIYVIGGYNNANQWLNTVEAYNPGTNTWTTLPSMTAARSQLAAATGPDQRIYAIGGGQNGFAPDDFSTVEAYTPPGYGPTPTATSTPTSSPQPAATTCAYTFEDGTTQGWTKETHGTARFMNNTARVVNSTTQNTTPAGSHALEVDLSVASNAPMPYTTAEGFVALPGAQPTGTVTFSVYPPAGTRTTAFVSSTVGLYAVGADGQLYTTYQYKVDDGGAAWNQITRDASAGQWVGGGTVSTTPPAPYASFGLLFQYQVDGATVGGTVATYVDDVSFSGGCPQTVAITPGQPVKVARKVGSNQVALNVPSGESIAQLTLSTLPAPTLITAPSPTLQTIPGAAIAVMASDSAGDPVTQLAAPVGVSITFSAPSAANAELAQIYTVDANGQSQALSTRVQANGDGTYTATAETPHFSPFEVFAPNKGVSIPQVYVPVVDNAAPAGW